MKERSDSWKYSVDLCHCIHQIQIENYWISNDSCWVMRPRRPRSIPAHFRFSTVNKSILSQVGAVKFESQKDYPSIHRMINLHFALLRLYRWIWQCLIAKTMADLMKFILDLKIWKYGTKWDPNFCANWQLLESGHNWSLFCLEGFIILNNHFCGVPLPSV